MLIWLWSFLLAAAIVIGFNVTVLMSHLEVKLVISKQGKHERVWIGIRAVYGIVRWRYEIRSIQFQNFKQGFSMKSKQKEQSWAGKHKERMRNFIGAETIKKWNKEIVRVVARTYGFEKWGLQTLDHIEVDSYIWDTEYGTTNAAHTGMLYGLAWAVIGGVTGFITQLLTFRRLPDVEVVPRFDCPVFSTRFLCIGRIRVVHAIFAVIVLIFRIKRAEGGVKQWRSIQSKA
ncbi:DUF2953 domain-containing protein [Paenibacillus agilis]|uniref:DUF2953 domain-containing protein n=1 Tax=Paenibacillus agilis TaxID=3020863 RepID=A0A559IYZ9_9BACL|nr:DUF2953 domain-containing protein [Paenibacillus agilis]TVX92846.1 DUF2953 domain-containing protein [Paenibacillus agilis]